MQQHWSGYMKAFEKQVIQPPASSNAYATTDSRTGMTGFLDVMPTQPQVQARYDAMSGNWEGVDATNKALAHGVFSTDPMPIKQLNTNK